MIIHGECLDEMHKMDDCSIDFIVTDSPYGISFMSKKWDKNIPPIEYWKEMLRICKPGSFIAAAGLPRMIHRLTCVIEDAGWIIRDLIMHIFGSGFPKSHNHFGLEGYGSALKPAWEGWILAMKPFDGTYAKNVEKWGLGGINIDDCRIATNDNRNRIGGGSKGNGGCYGNSNSYDSITHEQGRWPANLILDESFEQILCLKDNIPYDMMNVIQEFFYDYKLPNLPKRNTDISQQNQEKQGSILQQRLLLPRVENSHEGGKTLHVWQKSQERINPENETTSYQKRMGQPHIQGTLDGEGIPIHQHSSFTNRSSDHCQANVESGWNSRTSFNDGIKDGKTIENLGSCPSCEWDQRRQQDGKFGSIGQFNAQERTQGNIEGAESIKERKRRLEILACDIPEKWMKYFESSGPEIRSPYCSAEMLDRQSGILKSGAHNGILGKPGFESGFKPVLCSRKADSGGASRFFYCAKASSKEKNAGLEGMPLIRSGTERMNNSTGHKQELGEAEKLILTKNSHPTVKPLSLMRYILKLLAPPNNPIVLDPFAGSGSTLCAAKQLGIRHIGIELEKDYCEIAQKRLNYTEKFTELKND